MTTDTTTNALAGYDRFIGKATPKGLVLKALAKNGATVASYFIAVRAQEFVGPFKRMPTFEPVTDEAEIATLTFFANRSWNVMTPGELAAWD
jgi:hypothetical protein